MPGVPHTTSSHSLHLPPDYPTGTKRRDLLSLPTASPLNFSQLISLLNKARGSEDDSDSDSVVEIIDKPPVKGKGKRSASPFVSEEEKKRGKKPTLAAPLPPPPRSSLPSSSSAEHIEVDLSDKEVKNLIVIRPASSLGDSLPLFYHTLEQTPLLPPPPPDIHQHYRVPSGKIDELERLQSALAAQFEAKDKLLSLLESEQEDEEINLGPVYLFPFGRTGGPSILSRPPTEEEMEGGRSKKKVKEEVEKVRVMDCRLLETQDLEDTLSDAGFDRSKWGDLSWLHALSLLVASSPSPRVSLQTNLCLTRLSLSPGADTLPFKLTLRFRASLPTTSLFAPCPPTLLDAQRLLFTALLPPVPKPAAFHAHGQTTLPFFYSILKPAAAFDDDENEDAAQPAGLKPKLYPFQRRSVRWMLEREGKTFSLQGKVVKLEDTEGEVAIGWEAVALPLRTVPPFGDEVELVEAASGKTSIGSFWFDRLTGALADGEEGARQDQGFMDLEAVKGGMLAEEMGLGKTLEVISLILLNPCSPKNLTRPYRDHDLKLLVKPSKTTLIVAPPTLTQQWVDEIALHSPSLKTYVYDGYKRLPFSTSAGKANKNALVYKQKMQGERARARMVVDSDEEDEARDTGEAAWWRFLEKGDYDVVIVTYMTLSNELGVAKHPGDGRPRRATVEYSDHYKSRSPLVMTEWTRVVMDEVQMQGSGTIAEMVSLLPRRSSFAVSGTPARNKVEDLQQALRFLRVPTLASSLRIWNRLLAPGFATSFEQLFNVIATRTTKKMVKHEMEIPSQRRFLFPIDLSPIEFAFYSDTFARALEELDPQNLDLQTARAWLFSLRQIATHLQIGQLNGRGNGAGVRLDNDADARRGRANRARGGRANRGRYDPLRGEREGGGRMQLGGALLTIEEVLEKMMEANESEMSISRRAELVSKTTHGQLLILRKELDPVPERISRDTREAHSLYLDVLIKVDPLIDEAKVIIADLEKERAALVATYQSTNQASKGMGKRRAVLDSDEEDESDESEEGGMPQTPAQRAKKVRLVTLKSRLRELLECKHRVAFYLGDWYHVAEKKEEEDAHYALAEVVRRTVLNEPEVAANAAISIMRKKLSKTDVDQREMEVGYCEKGGILTHLLVEQADEVVDLLNDNRELCWNWRGKIVTLLTAPLHTTADEENGADGDEYNKALNEQVEVEAYLQAYVSALADRREMLTENRTVLAEAAAREIKHRGTNRAKEAKEAATAAGVELGIIIGDQQELKTLLMTERAALRLNPPKLKRGAIPRVCIKSLVNLFKETSERAPNKMEQAIAEKESSRLRKVIRDQETIIGKLEDELDVLRAAFNERILFFKAFQALSDSVATVQVVKKGGIDGMLTKCMEDEAKLANRIAQNVARSRFLASMKNVFSGELSEEDKECIICREDIDRGVLLECSHLFCSSCFDVIPQTCPVCRQPVDRGAVHRIRLRRPEGEKKKDEIEDAMDEDEDDEDEEVNEADPKGKGKAKPPKKKKKAAVDDSQDVNYVSTEDRVTIAATPIFGDWGSKINMMIKHLLHLRATDLGSKAVVFSAFKDGLDILARAMTDNGIRYVSTSSANAKTIARTFKIDPLIQVFLLHSERESAGLTLTVAKYVFLLEPTLSPSFELQAIGRVDRLGQKQETKVFCYVVNETVDANIVRLSVAKGTSIYLKQAQGSALPIDPTRPSEGAVDGSVLSKTNNSDFIAKGDDLFSLLFPDRLGLNREAIVDISDDEEGAEENEDEEEDEDAPIPRALAGSAADRGGLMDVDMDDEEEEEPVAGPSRLG